jgi:hypothetical protein
VNDRSPSDPPLAADLDPRIVDAVRGAFAEAPAAESIPHYAYLLASATGVRMKVGLAGPNRGIEAAKAAMEGAGGFKKLMSAIQNPPPQGCIKILCGEDPCPDRPRGLEP